jgi:hypothetical protein
MDTCIVPALYAPGMSQMLALMQLAMDIGSRAVGILRLCCALATILHSGDRCRCCVPRWTGKAAWLLRRRFPLFQV